MTHFSEVTTAGIAKDYVESLDRDSLIIYSPTSLSLLNSVNPKVHMIDCRIFGRNVALMNALCSGGHQYQKIVSIGGGTATDVAKYIATTMDVPFVCIPPMLSTNAYATNKVALVVGDEKITLDAKLADEIILDEWLIEQSSLQNLYGLADVFSIHTALFDWKLAHDAIDEEVDPEIFAMAERLLLRTCEHVLHNSIEEIMSQTGELFALIGESGYITNLYGTGRPESGSEHIFAKRIEKLIDVHHGLSVSVGVILMSLLQNNYSDEVVRCLQKIGVFNKARDYGLSKNILAQALRDVRPRSDRYSIIDTVSLTERKVALLLDEFVSKTGIVLG